jgi:hypothetical protein
MKKNLVIGILSLVSVFSLAFGYQQKVRADKNEVIALENEKRALELEKAAEVALDEAKHQKMIAELNMVEAMKQRELAAQKK